MKKETKLMSYIKHNDQPYWPTLKLILSSLIVFNFYLNLADKNKFSLLISIFDLTLIPMFVFIVAFVTKNITWKGLGSHLLPAIIIYFTFQTIDMIPLYFTGELTLKTYFLSPQNGVWFFLATPVWQCLFLLLPKNIKSNKLTLFLVLVLSLIIAYLTKTYLIDASSFFSVLVYFPFFILAYFLNEENIFSLRKKTKLIILPLTTLAVLSLHYKDKINDVIFNKEVNSLFPSSFIMYILTFIIGIILCSSIIYFALSTNKYEKISNNALGIYLIHPIICFVILQTLYFLGIELNLLLIIAFTLLTIGIALLLASNSIVHWFIDPIFHSNKLK